MKRCTVLTVLLLGVACSTFGEQIVPKPGRIILKDSCSSPWIDIQWEPTEQQTEQALTAISRFLNNEEAVKEYGERQAAAAIEIRKHFAEYRIQFSGVIENGTEYIHCNFFPANRSFSSNWTREYICVFDSGFWYWNILYDPLTGKTIKFQINGFI